MSAREITADERAAIHVVAAVQDSGTDVVAAVRECEAIVFALSRAGLLAQDPELAAAAADVRAKAGGTLTYGAYARMRTALSVMQAARRQHGEGMVPLVQALESACVLQSPESATELVEFRTNFEQLQRVLADQTTRLIELEDDRSVDLPVLRESIAGWAERCRGAEAERDALRVRNAELEAAVAALPGATWFLADNEGGVPTLHATLDSAQAWGVAELAVEFPDRPVDWFEEDGLHFLRFVHPDDDRPLHRTTVSVLPLTVEGAVPVSSELTVYRAAYDESIAPLGLYTTPGAAREHCEAYVRREQPAAALAWIEDDEDGVAELAATVDGEERTTGYLVTALTVDAAFDPDGDE